MSLYADADAQGGSKKPPDCKEGEESLVMMTHKELIETHILNLVEIVTFLAVDAIVRMPYTYGDEEDFYASKEDVAAFLKPLKEAVEMLLPDDYFPTIQTELAYKLEHCRQLFLNVCKFHDEYLDY